MKNIDISCGSYGAKWGLTDFYDDSKEKLISALESGEDFKVEYGCKKEIRYASIAREGNKIEVSVTACMDDLYEQPDLIYDALFDALGVEEELTDEQIEDIRSYAADMWISEETTQTQTIPASSTLEEICKAIEELEVLTEENNSEVFKLLCEIVKSVYKESTNDRCE